MSWTFKENITGTKTALSEKKKATVTTTNYPHEKKDEAFLTKKPEK